MPPEPISKHASFTIVFLPHFADNAAPLLEKLKDEGFLQRLASNSDDARAELSDLGIEIKGKDSRLLDETTEMEHLKEEMEKFRIRPKNPPQLGWCKIMAIAAAATEAAP